MTEPRKLSLLLGAILLTTGCSTTVEKPEIPVRGGGSGYLCQADGLPDARGQKATAERGAELLSASGARSLRWIPPRAAVTMDYREDRLNISYDDDLRILSVRCG